MKRKYRNIPTVVDGRRFDSKREAGRFCELKLMEKAGEIESLECQPEYVLAQAGKRKLVYRADFRYLDKRTGEIVTEDCKGFKTEGYRIKKFLMKAFHQIDVLET